MANMEEMVAEQVTNEVTEQAVEAVGEQAMTEVAKQSTGNRVATVAKDAGVVVAIGAAAVGIWEGGKWLFKKCKKAYENHKAKKEAEKKPAEETKDTVEVETTEEKKD